MYNPDKHHRRSIRLKNYDYANAGAYFVTVCCWNRECLFGEIVDGKMILNEYGEIAHDEWVNLFERYINVSFNVFQIMPNHIHGIIEITATPTAAVGATLAVAPIVIAQNNEISHNNVAGTQNNAITQNNAAPDTLFRATARVAPTVSLSVDGNDSSIGRNTVGRIVGAYKSLVFNRCLELSKQKKCILGQIWQRNFHEHIIRNDAEYERIAKYIRNNPISWKKDCFNVYRQR